MRRLRIWSGALALAGCAAAAIGPALRWTAPARGPKTSNATGPAGAAYDREIAGRFAAARAGGGDLTFAQLNARLDLSRAPESGPSFDPTSARYWNQVRDGLALTQEEQAIFKRTGVVGVDFVQRATMAGAYLAIYQRDLPVLITTDSILQALHRSFDNLLVELETEHFAAEFKRILAEAHGALRRETAALSTPTLRQNAQDVDLYLTVARNLLAEPPRAEIRDALRACMEDSGTATCDRDKLGEGVGGPPAIPSLFQQDDAVSKVLDAIRALRPASEPALYGRRGFTVDWSQFTPRGHYTKSAALRRYFRTLMWLGRVDLGFVVGAPDGAFGACDVARERRDALLLTRLLEEADVSGALAAIDRAIAFLVGLSDDATARDLAAGMRQARIARVTDLDDAAKVNEALAAAAQTAGQRIRSQIGWRPPGAGEEKPLPPVFQLFGQRFVLDSFVLSKVVFDSISYRGKLQERTMPVGLDVMAALGNDEAVALLEPELTRWNYGANLLAARRVVEERPPEAWNATLYDTWLAALTKLDDTPAGELPEVMRGRAWQRKQLETQLASWAELRHDTILYAKQSYTMGILCEYPAGYVEPYPELFGRLALFADMAAQHLAGPDLASPGARAFLGEFAGAARRLEALARTELDGRPFSRDEEKFVKDAIQVRTESGGCGPPIRIYTGWYPKLLYRGKPDDWEPTVADVHTDPNSDSVLEEATGDVNFVVVAVNNRDDRAVYVGPVYSYYEFTSGHRMTDEEWRKQIAAGQAGPHPAWSSAWRAPPASRGLSPRRR